MTVSHINSLAIAAISQLKLKLNSASRNTVIEIIRRLRCCNWN